MKKFSQSTKAIEDIVERYRSVVSVQSEASFSQKPHPHSWSLSEIVHHAFDTSMLSLQAIGHISEGREEKGSLTFSARIIFLFGAMPPWKLKAPRVILNRVKSISLIEAINMMETFETKLTFTLNLLKTANLQGKIRHPRLGYLDAAQWFRFTEIHLKHHLKQLEDTKSSIFKALV